MSPPPTFKGIAPLMNMHEGLNHWEEDSGLFSQSVTGGNWMFCRRKVAASRARNNDNDNNNNDNNNHNNRKKKPLKLPTNETSKTRRPLSERE